jgi:hypothetical protein
VATDARSANVSRSEDQISRRRVDYQWPFERPHSGRVLSIAPCAEAVHAGYKVFPASDFSEEECSSS